MPLHKNGSPAGWVREPCHVFSAHRINQRGQQCVEVGSRSLSNSATAEITGMVFAAWARILFNLLKINDLLVFTLGICPQKVS